MKLNNTPANPAEMSDGLQSSEFSIRASAKAFQILSDGLYSDKITAILRELGCNAYDSHVAAGRPDTPFDVHLPNSLQPHFSIRDYGVGLDDEEVRNIYTTYFESTKTDSNDYVGALGLGSKSPFSYTDNFTVTAIKDGVKRLYSAYINEQGFPSILLMSTTATADPTGVEIKFSVEKKEDFQQFVYKAQQTYQWFKTKPCVSGQRVQIPEIKILERDIVSNVHRFEKNYYNSDSYAFMGNIAYPIQSSDIPMSSLDRVGVKRETLERLSMFLKQSLLIEFEIGEIEFSASRESLSYTEKTVKAIIKRLIDVERNLYKRFVNLVEDDVKDNPWYIAQKVYKYSREPLYRHCAHQYVTSNAKSFPFSGSSSYPSNSSYPVEFKDLVFDRKTISEKFNIEIRQFKKRRSWGNDWGNSITDYNQDSKNIEIPIVNRDDFLPVIVQNDGKTKGILRLKNHFRNNDKAQESNILLLLRADTNQPMDVAGFAKMLHDYPVKEIIDFESLDNNPTKSTKKAEKNVILSVIEQKKSYYSSEMKQTWNTMNTQSVLDSAEESDVPFLFFDMTGYDTHDSHGNPIEMKKVIAQINQCNIEELKKIKIFAVRKEGKPLIEGGNWEYADVWISRFLNDQTDDFWNAVVFNSSLSRMLRFFNSSILDKINDTDSLAKKIIQMSLRSKNNTTPDLFAMKNLTTVLNVDIDFDAKEAKMNRIVTEFKSRYPLIELFNANVYSIQQYSAIAEYINLIDQSKGKK